MDEVWDEVNRKWVPRTAAIPAAAPMAQPAPAMAAHGQYAPGQFSPEQSAMMVEKYPAITKMESENARSGSLSDSLRGYAFGGDKKRMDWGSQGARALLGVASAMQAKKQGEGIKALDTARADYARLVANMMRGGRKGSGIDYERDDPDNYYMGQN